MIFYHRTDASNIKGILKYGLLCSHSNFWKGSGGCVYLSNISETFFGDILFEIRNLPDKEKLTRVSSWEFIYWDNIPHYMVRLKN